MSEIRPIVIIGTGLAGYSLAREFRKLSKEQPLLIITRDDGHSYSKPMLSTGFTKGKDADGLSMAEPGKMAEQLNADIRVFTEVTGIDTACKIIHIGEEQLAYHKLVLATGAVVNRLQFPGSDLPSVVSINDLMDYRHFRALVEGKKRILLMGAGLIGCEYANDLINGGYEVSIVDPASAPLAGLIPEFAGHALQSGLEQAGAQFHLGRHVTQLREQGGGIIATLDDGSELATELVVSAVGLRPDLTLAQQAGLACGRGILANRQLETSAPDVYVLGDAAEVEGRVLLYVLPLMACARALARTLNGEPTAVSYGVMPVVTKTPACPVVVSPPVSDDGGWHIDQDGNDISARFIDGEGQLLGFVLTGDRVADKQALSKETAPLMQ